MMGLRLIFVLLFFLVFQSVYAQQKNDNVELLYLKNGEKVKCVVLEKVPFEYYKVRTLKGEERKINISDIVRKRIIDNTVDTTITFSTLFYLNAAMSLDAQSNTFVTGMDATLDPLRGKYGAIGMGGGFYNSPVYGGLVPLYLNFRVFSDREEKTFMALSANLGYQFPSSKYNGSIYFNPSLGVVHRLNRAMGLEFAFDMKFLSVSFDQEHTSASALFGQTFKVIETISYDMILVGIKAGIVF